MKPINFNTREVQAILDGSKTMVRRVASFLRKRNPYWTGYIRDGLQLYNGTNEPCLKDPSYQPDDTLWVRETWVSYCINKKYCRNALLCHSDYCYKASMDSAFYGCVDELGCKWRPSIYMPKEAARIFLKVTDVSVEKLQDISPSDCICEGIDSGDILTNTPDGDFAKYAISQYARFWDDLHAKRGYGWDANPWVWVYEFEWIEGGQDE